MIGLLLNNWSTSWRTIIKADIFISKADINPCTVENTPNKCGLYYKRLHVFAKALIQWTRLKSFMPGLQESLGTLKHTLSSYQDQNLGVVFAILNLKSRSRCLKLFCRWRSWYRSARRWSTRPPSSRTSSAGSWTRRSWERRPSAGSVSTCSTTSTTTSKKLRRKQVGNNSFPWPRFLGKEPQI